MNNLSTNIYSTLYDEKSMPKVNIFFCLSDRPTATGFGRDKTMLSLSITNISSLSFTNLLVEGNLFKYLT